MSQFIPNDVESGDFPLNNKITKSKMKVITAPNASGKTLYLKQTALLVYMSMIGSYVAAESAYIGDFDRIFTRINSNDSVEHKMSTFAVDVCQITEAVIGSTEKSLVIIDEFGKGTDPNDAQALIAAIIDFWISEKQSPHVYLSTHYFEMFDFANFLFKENNNKIEYLTFEYLIEESDTEKINAIFNSKFYSKQNLTFMYKLKNGKTNSSFSLNIARKYDLPQSIMEKACNLTKSIKAKLQNDDLKLHEDFSNVLNISEHIKILKE